MYAPLSGQRLGFVGLGNMGRAMARHLHTAGAEVVVWNRSAAPAEAAVALGMRRATSLPDLARAVGPGVICLNLTTTQVVEEVVFGPEGLIGGLDPGALVIDFGKAEVRADVAGAIQRAAGLDGFQRIAVLGMGQPGRQGDCRGGEGQLHGLFHLDFPG